MGSSYSIIASEWTWRDQPDESTAWKDTTANRWHRWVNFKQGGGDPGEWDDGVPDISNTEYGRRPYIGGSGEGTSYVEQMRRTPDKSVFSVALQKQSEFKKPYTDDDGYPEMEYWHPWSPWQPWGDWIWDDPPYGPEFPMLPDQSVLRHITNNCPLLIFGQTLWRECSKDYKIRPIYGREFKDLRLDKTEYGLSRIIKWNATSATIRALKADGAPNWVIQPLHVVYDDGSICEYEMDNVCRFDEPPITFVEPLSCCDDNPDTFADNGSDTTIAPGGSATLITTGGCPNYSWEITSGTGYTLGSTTGVTINVTSASGVCGVDYSSSAVITVTDECGSTLSFTLRNTGGKWNLTGAPIRAQNTCGSVALCNTTKTVYYTSGLKMWSMQIVTRHLPVQCPCAQNSANWGGWTQGAGAEYPDITPYQFWSTYYEGAPDNCGSCSGAEGSPQIVQCVYYAWGC